MKSIVCVAIIVGLAGLVGCAKQQTAPGEAAGVQAAPQPEATPISTEDFESGEAAGALQGGGETGTPTPENEAPGATP